MRKSPYVTLLNIYDVGKSEIWPRELPIPRIGERLSLHDKKYAVLDIEYQVESKNIFIITSPI